MERFYPRLHDAVIHNFSPDSYSTMESKQGHLHCTYSRQEADSEKKRQLGDRARKVAFTVLLRPPAWPELTVT